MSVAVMESTTWSALCLMACADSRLARMPETTISSRSGCDCWAAAGNAMASELKVTAEAETGVILRLDFKRIALPLSLW